MFWKLLRQVTLCVTALWGVAYGNAAEFMKPVQMKAGDQYVRVGSPGYAAPCWDDIDKDGKKDLLVGQFHHGKIKVYKNLGDGKLAAGKWFEAEGEVARVDGVY